MLRITEQRRGDVMVLSLHGNISGGASEVKIGDTIRRVRFRGYHKVLLNLEAATSSDASGVSALLGSLIDARTVDAELKLVHVAREMMDHVSIAALHRNFTVFDCEDEALDSFGLARPG